MKIPNDIDVQGVESVIMKEILHDVISVSYTHLTLPTNREV